MKKRPNTRTRTPRESPRRPKRKKARASRVGNTGFGRSWKPGPWQRSPRRRRPSLRRWKSAPPLRKSKAPVRHGRRMAGRRRKREKRRVLEKTCGLFGNGFRFSDGRSFQGCRDSFEPFAKSFRLHVGKQRFYAAFAGSRLRILEFRTCRRGGIGIVQNRVARGKQDGIGGFSRYGGFEVPIDERARVRTVFFELAVDSPALGRHRGGNVRARRGS